MALLRITLLFVLVQLTACKKFIDKYFPDDNHKDCKIVSIKQGFDINGPFRTGTFTYNNAGLPLSAVFDVTGSGSPSHYFKYDQQNRLIEYRSEYAPGDTQSIHTYGYENGRIVIDSSEWWEAGQWKQISTLEYDNQGRIIKEVKKCMKLMVNLHQNLQLIHTNMIQMVTW